LRSCAGSIPNGKVQAVGASLQVQLVETLLANMYSSFMPPQVFFSLLPSGGHVSAMHVDNIKKRFECYLVQREQVDYVGNGEDVSRICLQLYWRAPSLSKIVAKIEAAAKNIACI
jgi:hypothetical protein